MMPKASPNTPTFSTAEQPPRLVRLTFTQGFLCGQLSLILVVVLFIKYVIFENPETSRANRRQQRPRRSSTLSSRRSRPSFAERNVKPLFSELLSKLSYDLSTHPPETADWLNVLVAQAIVAYRSLVHGELDKECETLLKGEKAKQMVEEALNFGRDGEPGFISVDYITVTDVDFGDRFPLCSNARVRPADETGRMRIEVDIDYSDHVTLAIETKVVINFPTSRFAVLPVSLGLTLNQLSATIMAEIPPAAIPLPVNENPATSSPAILLSLDPDFTLGMSVTSLLGARAKLEDIPKVEQLILGRLRGWIVDNLVWPKVRVLQLPGVGSKGAVENGENGEGEYVWVESEALPPEEPPKLSSAHKLVPEADEDPSSPPPVLSSFKDGQHSMPRDFGAAQVSDFPVHETRSGRYRSNSSSSRPVTSRSAGNLSNEFTTPSRLAIPERLEPNLSPSNPNLVRDLNFSDTSSPYRHGTSLRYSTSMMTSPTQLYRAAFANSGFEKRETSEFRREDAERWAHAGGMWGMSLGLNNNGVSEGNGTYGIRERVKEAKRIQAKDSLTSMTGNLMQE